MSSRPWPRSVFPGLSAQIVGIGIGDGHSIHVFNALNDQCVAFAVVDERVNLAATNVAGGRDSDGVQSTGHLLRLYRPVDGLT